MKTGYLALLAGVGLTVANPSSATIYNLLPYQWQGTNSAVATLETHALGVYEGADAISTLLNSSTYSVRLYSGDSLLASMDNSIASWFFVTGPMSVDVVSRLTIDETQMVLTFDTPQETTEGRLLLRSELTPHWFTLQYAQANNVTNYNFADVDYNAIYHATAPDTTYGSSFVFTAVTPTTSVPEPATVGLLAVGLLGVILTLRRRSAVSAQRSQNVQDAPRPLRPQRSPGCEIAWTETSRAEVL